MNLSEQPLEHSNPASAPPSFEPHRRGVREYAAIAMASLALGGAIGAAGHEAEVAEAKPAPKTAVVPNVKGDTLLEARAEASQAGLRVVGTVNVGKDKKLDAGEQKVATGLDARVTVKRKIGGKLVPRRVFRLVRPGKLLKRGTAVRTRYEIEDVDEVNPPGENPGATPPGNPNTQTPPAPEFNLGAETDRFLKENAVQIPALSFCSGLRYTNAAGVAVGVASATHCLNLSRVTTDARGNQILQTDQPLIVRGGDQEQNFQNKGEIDRLLVADDGEDNDLTLIVMKGQSDQDAIQSFAAGLMTDSSVNELPDETQVLSIGYALNLPNNPGAPRVAQKLTGTIIAPVSVRTSLYAQLPTIMVGYKPGDTGPTCAPGYSGAIAVITQEGTNPDGSKRLITRYLGPDSAIDDFRPPPFNVYTNLDPVYANKDIFTERKNQYGFTTELDPYKNGVVCYFNNRMPAKWKTIKLVSSYSQIQTQSLGAAPPPSGEVQNSDYKNLQVLDGSR